MTDGDGIRRYDGSHGLSRHGKDCSCVRCQGFRQGNLSALKSGATSELTLAPLRAELDLELAGDYPELDGRRRAILADRLARLALAWRWLDEQPSIVRDGKGRIYDIADRVERWASRAEAILAELEAEQRQRDRPQDIAAGLAALEAKGAA